MDETPNATPVPPAASPSHPRVIDPHTLGELLAHRNRQIVRKIIRRHPTRQALAERVREE